ncbi:helix-turn-helix domain-containing protein [Uliginosibacterium paludis]|uniref:Helix-turn-helix transcriptional regulator n=1 Tax=Uliginosibacterium paludis TaxID=1615952 RepID=A0ABV2CP65_9RHOO
MNAQQIRRLREARAWSQEHLAEAAGLSLRTIQRVEAEGKASAETRLALAGAFGIPVAELSAGPAEISPEPASRGPAAETGDTPAAIPVTAPMAAPPARQRMSWAQYRVLRILVIIAFLLALDVFQHGTITWSRWPLLGLSLVCLLRWLRCQYVEPKPERR